jgi:acyl carrier protein
MIYQIIQRETGQSVFGETPLSDLNVDSLEFLQLLLTLQEETGKTIPDDRVASLKTVGDLALELA